MTYAKGIDVAYYDRGLNWSRYDWDFAYIKVSEGLVVDSEFKTHWQAAKGNTYRGGYHFARHFTDAKQSALKCIEYMGGDIGELPLWYDMEEISDSPSTLRAIAAYAKSWLSWYEQETGVRPMIYTAQNVLYALLAAADISWMSNYKLCLAQYRYDNLSVETRTRVLHQILIGGIAYSFPLAPSPFKSVTMVQWTGKGHPADVPGYYTGTGGKLAVDFDFYNGDKNLFMQEFGLQPLGDSPSIPPTQPPTDTGEPQMERWQITWDNGARLRSGPSIENSGGAILPDNAIVSVQRVQTVLAGVEAWAQHENGQWFATVYNGNVRAVRLSAPPVEPPAVDYIVHHRADGSTKKYIPE
jgi:GH25 family lysozyme M1 (1,4-beta-N-acetylmuramidase)